MMIDALPISSSSSSITYVSPAAMNDASKKALRDLQREFRLAGWKYETLKCSAIAEWIWTKDDTTVTLVGWHGTGSYGVAMVFWEVRCAASEQLHGLYDATGYPVGSSGLPSSDGSRDRLFASKDSDHYITQVVPAVLAQARTVLAR